MNKILIITQKKDETVEYFIKKFNKKAEFYRLNLDELKNYQISIIESDIIIGINGEEVELSKFKSIYYRKPRFPLLEDYDPSYHELMKKDILTFITGIADGFEGRCLSKPSTLRQSENKVYQIQKAKKVGFEVADTLITNSSLEANKFINKNQCIIKPLSLGKFYTSDHVHLIHTELVRKEKEVENIELSPSYFQEYIDKEYEVRLTIVDKRLFPVKVVTNGKVDWRTNHGKGVTFEAMRIPKEIEEKCLKLLNKLNLSFGAFDFLVKDDNFIFLEVNPNGQWLWLEKELNLNISDAIFEYLIGDSND